MNHSTMVVSEAVRGGMIDLDGFPLPTHAKAADRAASLASCMHICVLSSRCWLSLHLIIRTRAPLISLGIRRLCS